MGFFSLVRWLRSAQQPRSPVQVECFEQFECGIEFFCSVREGVFLGVGVHILQPRMRRDKALQLLEAKHTVSKVAKDDIEHRVIAWIIERQP